MFVEAVFGVLRGFRLAGVSERCWFNVQQTIGYQHRRQVPAVLWLGIPCLRSRVTSMFLNNGMGFSSQEEASTLGKPREADGPANDGALFTADSGVCEWPSCVSGPILSWTVALMRTRALPSARPLSPP
jgi:hypothetical protein